MKNQIRLEEDEKKLLKDEYREDEEKVNQFFDKQLTQIDNSNIKKYIKNKLNKYKNEEKE